LLNPVNILFIFLIFFYLIHLKYKKKIIRLILIIVAFFLILVSFFPIGVYGIKYLERDYINQIQIKSIDNIIVLAGSERGNTKFTNKVNLNDGSERLISSIKLALENPDAKIIFLGGDGNLIKEEHLDESNVALKFYKDLRFDLKRVIFISSSRNTIENLSSLKKKNILTGNSVIVTSAFHMKRSMIVAKKLNMNLIPYAVDFRSSNVYSFINKYQSFDIVANLTYFNIFFREIIGILAFKLFY